jgi:outer membrane protein assembly factor BamB
MGFMGRSGRIQELWDVDIGSEVIAPPLLADIDGDGEREIIIGTQDGKVICYRQNGQELWNFQTQEKVGKVEKMFLDTEEAFSISCKPELIEFGNKKLVIVGTDLGAVIALNVKGQPIWRFEAGGSIRGGFLIADVNGDKKSEIVFGSKDKVLYVLTVEGKVLKQFNVESGIKSLPLFNHLRNEIIVGDESGIIHAYNITGKETWSFDAEGAILGSPSMGQLFGTQENHLVFGTSEGKVYAISDDGSPRWEFLTQGAVATKPALIDFNKDKKLEIVIGCSDSNVYTLNAGGEKIWSFESNFWINSDPIVVDIDDDGELEVIAGSYDHNVYVLDVNAAYDLDYIPGISGVVHQAGSYSDIQTVEPGENVAKKIWTYKTKGIIMGMALNPQNKLLLVVTKNGHLTALAHIKR